MARGIYYGGGHTRGGQTEPTRRRRGVSQAYSRQALLELQAMRDEVAGQIAEADEQRDSELLAQCETRLALLNKSIGQHQSNLRAAELGRAGR